MQRRTRRTRTDLRDRTPEMDPHKDPPQPDAQPLDGDARAAFDDAVEVERTLSD